MTRTPRTHAQWRADVVAILSLVLPIFFGTFFVQYARVSLNPATGSGVVREKLFTEGRGEDADRFLLRYSFTTPSGAEYRGQAAVSENFYKKVSTGDRVEIQYASDDPGNNRVANQFDPLSIEFFGMIALGLGLFVYLGPRRWLRTWRGEPDPGPLE